MQSTSVTSKGQVTIPQELRQRLGIRAGSRIRFDLKGDTIEMRVESRPAEPVPSGFGMIKSQRKPVPADLDVSTLLKK